MGEITLSVDLQLSYSFRVLGGIYSACQKASMKGRSPDSVGHTASHNGFVFDGEFVSLSIVGLLFPSEVLLITCRTEWYPE